jgi:DNA-binding transcriptional regulator GbsR (MarR family)
MTGDLVRLFSDTAAEIGFSRPAGACFAAIWAAPAPPTADDLKARLGLSRSNISTALKELRLAGLIGVERLPGDRKEYFIAPADPWEILRLLIAQRRIRVIAPLLDRIARTDGTATLRDALGALDAWLEAAAQLSPEALARALSEPPEGGDGAKKKKKKKK